MSRVANFSQSLAKWLVWTAISLALNPTELWAVDQEQLDDASLVRSLTAAWRQNRSSLARFCCRYHVMKARAATRDDALAGKLDGAIMAQCVWAVDGQAERCSIDVDDKSVPKTVTANSNGTGIMTSPISSQAYLTNGSLQLFSGSVIGAATLYRDGLVRQGNDLVTPFSMSFRFSPAEFIEKHLGEGNQYEVREGSGIDGGEGITVFLDLGTGNSYSYTFDPQHGFLVSRMTTEAAGRLSTEVYVTAAKQGPDEKWFPMRSLKLNFPSTAGMAILVQRIDVTELEFSPEPRDFALMLPANTKLVDRADAHSQHRLRQPLEITPATLPDLEAHLRQVAAAGQGGSRLDVELSQPSQTNWWLIASASVLTVVLVWVLLRKSRWSDSRI